MSIKSFFLKTLLLALGVVTLLSCTGGTDAPELLEVTYYYLPG